MRARPGDVTLTLKKDGLFQSIYADLAVVTEHCLHPSRRPQNLVAVSKKEREKSKDFKEDFPEFSEINFYPVVVNTYGGFGEPALALFRLLANQLSTLNHTDADDEFMRIRRHLNAFLMNYLGLNLRAMALFYQRDPVPDLPLPVPSCA